MVGYGVEKGKQYWLIKNSWGRRWGHNGFIKVAIKNNTCGVLTNEPIFVTFEDNWKEKENTFPFTNMTRKKLSGDEVKPMVENLKISPFDYKRSGINSWIPYKTNDNDNSER